MDGAELLLLLAQQSVSIHPPLSSHRSDNVASSLSRLDQRPSVHDNDDGDEIDQVHHTDTTPPAPLHPNSTTDKLQKKTRAVSCEKCHSAKRRCDRTRPSCAACLKRNVSCHYLADQSPDASAPRVSSLKMHPTQKAAKKQKLASDPSDATTTLPQTLSTLQVNSPTVSTPITPIYLSPSSHDTTAHLLTTASTGAQDPVDLLLMRLAKMRSTNPAAPPKKLALKMMALLDPETGTKVYHCIACRKRYITSSGLRYHLNEEHDARDQETSFPRGYFWLDQRRADKEASAAGGAGSAYACRVPGCSKRYTALSGIKYHLRTAHLDVNAMPGGVAVRMDSGFVDVAVKVERQEKGAVVKHLIDDDEDEENEGDAIEGKAQLGGGIFVGTSLSMTDSAGSSVLQKVAQ